MRVLITGASGAIGTALRSALVDRGDTIVAVSRTPAGRADPNTTWIGWDDAEGAVGDVDALVHLSGAHLAVQPRTATGDLTPEAMVGMLSSRVGKAATLARAVQAAARKPGVFVCASAGAMYNSPDPEATVDEGTLTDLPGQLPDMCRDWEAAARGSGIRTVLTRFGNVLDSVHGGLERSLEPTKRFLGGPIDDGRSWVAWIHKDDAVGILVKALDDPAMQGPYNIVGPNPLRSAEFARAIDGALGRPAALRPLRKLVYLRTKVQSQPGRRILPKRALEAGYQFKWPAAAPALDDILG